MGMKLNNNQTEYYLKTIPGPGSTSPLVDKIKPKAPVYSFGNNFKQFTGEMAKTPGPGAYNPPNQKVVTPATGKSQRFTAKNNTNPGPGQYKLHAMVGNVPSYALPNEF